ncbi:class I SAM-dependent methyltransferase [uncultured Rhodoblastus sp.]|uniref:class I SAM-dependent methyltransferase n=1 Tax=uncultured Rhodoblastus sp. TaxID=543037 RepID=UPI0025D6EAA1|nr:class I SAM-dependent methyltransferase [uncultured Rhodoblastus sp.]
MKQGELIWRNNITTSASCPICGDVREKKHMVSVLNRLERGKKIDFYVCSSCDSSFAYPFTYPKCYSDEENPQYCKFYVEIGAGIDFIVNILAQFKDDSSINSYLDVGCGFGYSVDYARRLLKWDAVGVEPGVYGRIGAKALGLEIDPNILGRGSAYDNRQFDLILSSEVIEHVDNPDNYLKLLYSATKSGGKAVITTPAAEYVQPENWVDQVIATLSPGYHAFLYSQRAFDAALQKAGFIGVIVYRHQDRLIAVAGKDCSPKIINPFEKELDEQIRYYKELAVNSGDKNICNGAGFRLLKELVNIGDFPSAFQIWEDLRRAIEVQYGSDFFTNERLFLLSKSAKDFDNYGLLVPYFIAPLLFYRGMLALNAEANSVLAIEFFARAEDLALSDIDREHGYFIESASLLWPIKLHRGIALLRSGRRQEALQHLNEIIFAKLAPRQPWLRALLPDYIVSRAMKEAGVAQLQLSRRSEAKDMFGRGLRRPEESENKGLHEELRQLFSVATAEL